MDKNEEISKIINKISTHRAEQLDSFVAAVLKVRKDIGEEIDMNYIALEYSNKLDDSGIFVNTVRVVYTKDKR